MSYATYTHIGHTVPVLVLFVLCLLPLSVHAGLLSALFDTTAVQASNVTQSTQDDNAQVVSLLRAPLFGGSDSAVGGGDILVEDGVLISLGDGEDTNDRINTKTAHGEISVYVVRQGDTLSQIAEMFDVSGKTILWANDISDASKIHVGDTLIILPITGVRHVVKKGDTIASIAKKYTGNADEILSYNQLESASGIHIGDTLVIPDGTIVSSQGEKTTKGKGVKGASGNGSAGYTNPLPGAIKTQGIHGYNGVDLAGVPVGTSVLAAAAGDVIVAKGSGYNGGYGAYVVIRHPNGTQTLYAHLSKVYVVVGQKVKQGSAIGAMGNTGRSTGPHLHFEVRGARNPF